MFSTPGPSARFAISSRPSGPADSFRPPAIAATAAIAVAIAAFALYRKTLLPGVDFGDSGSMQTLAGWPLLTPRDGYPLYFGIADVILWLTGLAPAYAMNLTSAIEGALACGTFVLVAAEIGGSLPGAVSGAALFAVSYTFWSQSVTAEVYALHAFFVLGTFYCLLKWEQRPTTLRLAVVFVCYAIAFGNHLSMILLAPAITAFLFLAEPRGWRRLVSPPVIGLAVLIAVAGASQYVWNLRTLWLAADPPASLWDGLRTFWFDVTKSDWRETMVLNVPQSMLTDHLAMYWFDVRQQFGTVGTAASAAGLLGLALKRPKHAVLLALSYAVNVAFAFNYNVGDAHVFYLPAHLMMALAAGAGIPLLVTRLTPKARDSRAIAMAAVVLLGGYAVARGYHDYPALDRSGDTRSAQWLTTFTAGLDERRNLLLVDLNWQVANGLSYFTKSVAPHVLVARMRDVLLYAPAIILDNLSGGRSVLVNAQAGRLLADAYGPLFDLEPDAGVSPMRDAVAQVPPGTRYVLCLLKPTRDNTIDADDLEATIRFLTGGRDVRIAADRYAVIAGVVGELPSLVVVEERPFRRDVDLRGVPVEIRMEGWLASDTIRRMGFGHVVARRHHTLIVERGLSFVAFGGDGVPIAQDYRANLFAQQSRYGVRLAEARAFAGMLR
jgi:hypothetical protein